MLQYALLHLYGYAVSLDDLKAFRVGCIDFPAHPRGASSDIVPLDC